MDSPENRFILATWFRRLTPTDRHLHRRPHAGQRPPTTIRASSSSRRRGSIRSSRNGDERFDGTPPYRVPQLVYAPFPFDAEVRHWHGSFVVDVTPTFEQKMKAIRCYASQFDEDRFAKVRHLSPATTFRSAAVAASPTANISRCRR